MKHPATNIKPILGIEPDAHVAATYTDTNIDTRGFTHAIVIQSIGTLTATSTVTLKVQSSTTSGGTYADITGAAFTAIDEAVLDVSDTINFGVIRLHGVSRFLELEMVVGVAAADCAASIILINVDSDVDASVTPAFNV